MQSNPPWANRALKQNWSVVKATAEQFELPLPIETGTWKFEEFGCGHYGCVIPTGDSEIVFKLTSDSSEAEFIRLAEPLGWPEGIVKYFAIVPLDFTFRKRTVFAIWREAAFNVGELYEDRSAKEFARNLNIFRDHASRFRGQLKHSKNPEKLWEEARRLDQWAWDNFSVEQAKEKRRGRYGDRGFSYFYPAFQYLRGAQRLAASWRACEVIAEQMESTELSDLVGAALGFYMEQGFLLADVHEGNVGQVKREDYRSMPWVITDPGHVVVLGS